MSKNESELTPKTPSGEGEMEEVRCAKSAYRSTCQEVFDEHGELCETCPNRRKDRERSGSGNDQSEGSPSLENKTETGA